jgi:tRNA-dihydrouridine synthase B
LVKKLSGVDAPVVFREMVSSEAVVRGNEKTLGMTAIHPDERPLVQQIFGSDPSTMAEAGRIIEAEHHPEGFDINMGCPVYKIVHNFNGAALMKDPALAGRIIEAMKKAITVPLSVKIRLGWSDPRECLEFVKVLEEAGADLITIHGRTKTQGYSGVADWAMVGEAKKQVKIPVLCNGDVHTAERIVEALKVSGADGVLIARGALGNPWIFRDYALLARGETPPVITLEERIRIVKRHLDLHLEEYGDHGVHTFRKHLSWYFKGLPGAKAYRDPMMRANTKDELLKILNEVK